MIVSNEQMRTQSLIIWSILSSSEFGMRLKSRYVLFSRRHNHSGLQDLITQLDQQKKRNTHLIDSNVGYISDLESKSEKLTIAGTFYKILYLLSLWLWIRYSFLNRKAAESAENHARLVDARSELKAKENTIHELQKIVQTVKASGFQ